MSKLSIREIIDILINVDGFGYQKLRLIDDYAPCKFNEIGIRYDLPGDEHRYSPTQWKRIKGVWVPRKIECFIPIPMQKRFPEVLKYATDQSNTFLLPERLVNEIIHCYRFEFWTATLDRMRINNKYPQFWKKEDK